MIGYRYTALFCSLIGIAVYAGCGGADGGGSSSSGGPTTEDGGGSSGALGDGGLKGNAIAPTPSHGSTVALSPDDSRLVVANTDAGTVTVFSVEWADGAAPVLTKLVELPVGAEPSAVVVHPSGSAAFVIARKDQKLVRIDDLASSAPKIGPSAQTGSEPTGLALTPRGTTAWVASWIDGTVSGFDVDAMKVTSTVDLNFTLANAGYLGEVDVRPSLAHPRSIAITNNGDAVEDDETMWVTEFYAQTKAPLLADGSNADTARTGLVYRIPLKDKVATVVELPPMTDMGFKDHKGGTAGCFPNQLLNITIQGGFGYVLSVCASPKGPQGMFAGPAAKTCALDTECPGAVTGSCVSTKCTTNCTTDAECGAVGGKCGANFVCQGNASNVKTQVAPAISVIDLASGTTEAKTIATLNMAKEFDAEFTKRGMADDGTRRLPLTTFDIGFVPGTVTAYLPSRGTDAVFKIDFNATYEASNIDGLGDPKAPFINLVPAGVDPSRVGRMPTGLVVAHALHPKDTTTRYAFVANENTRNVAVLDLATQDIAGRSEGRPNVVSASALATDAVERDVIEGRRLFATGLGRWSLKGQGWGACESCHVDGLSDNVTWFFPRGPRQPNSLEALYSKKDPKDMRLQNWTAVQDEISDHEMGAIRGSLGGVGAIVSSTALDPASRIAIDKIGHAGLGGSSLAVADPKNPLALAQGSAIDDWKKMDTWARTVRSPRRPTNLDAAQVAAGKSVFLEGKCQGCHGGAKWTTSRVFYTPDGTNAVNASLKTASWTSAVQSAGFPTTLLPASTGANQMMRYNGTAGGDFDQIVCAIRPVGTFGVADPSVGVAELRRDMTAKAQGDETDGKGYNPPSLLGVQVGAPYFHAGQVRTLEALLSNRFSVHREALTGAFLAEGSPGREAKLTALVAYLLSIDEETEPVAIPAVGPGGGDFCKVP
jgi:hypothetical protein